MKKHLQGATFKSSWIFTPDFICALRVPYGLIIQSMFQKQYQVFHIQCCEISKDLFSLNGLSIANINMKAFHLHRPSLKGQSYMALLSNSPN